MLLTARPRQHQPARRRRGLRRQQLRGPGTGAGQRDDVIALAIAVPTYVVAAAVIGVVWGTATSLRALRWATQGAEVVPDREGAPPGPERPAPAHADAADAVAGRQRALHRRSPSSLQPERAVSTGLTVGIGALVVAGISYLLTEFTLRPVAARALADTDVNRRSGSSGSGPRMVLFWAIGTAVPVGRAARGRDPRPRRRPCPRTTAPVSTSWRSSRIVVCGAVLLFGFILTDLNARSVVAPIMSVREALRSVEEGDLDTDVVVYDGTELGALQSGFNQMVGGLREREKLRDLFGRHVGHEVAAAAAAVETGEVELGGETRVASVLFVDLVGSTAYASDHEPAEVVGVLNRFFGVVVDEVDRRGGLVNKFIGDAVLAIFGAPVPDEDHAASALAAARAMAIRLEEELPEIGAGIGVATGSVVAGNVGSRVALRVHRDRRRGELRVPPHRARQGRARRGPRHVGHRGRRGRARGRRRGRPLGEERHQRCSAGARRRPRSPYPSGTRAL